MAEGISQLALDFHPTCPLRVARSPAPHYPKPPRPGSLAPNIGDHGPSDSALGPPAAGDYAVQPLTGTRRAALLGTCARARAHRRDAPSLEELT